MRSNQIEELRELVEQYARRFGEGRIDDATYSVSELISALTKSLETDEPSSAWIVGPPGSAIPTPDDLRRARVSRARAQGPDEAASVASERKALVSRLPPPSPDRLEQALKRTPWAEPIENVGDQKR